MPLPEKNHFRQFTLFVFLLLVPCFAIWAFFSAALITPVIGLVHIALANWFPDIVNTVYPDGAHAILLTRFDQVGGQFVPSADADAALGFKINTRIVSYSIPFYAALHFATEKKAYLADFVWGVLTLYIFIFVGIVMLCMKNMMVTLGSIFLQQPGVWVPGPDTIGILYQFSVLIVPTLLPVLIWAWQSRHTPLLEMLDARRDAAEATQQ